MFGNASYPSMVFAYGCKAPHVAAKLVDDQIYAAHKYRNRLVEIERGRREQVETAIATMFPELDALESRIKGIEECLESQTKGVTEKNAAARKRRATKEEQAAIRELRATLRTLRAERKAARTEAFGSVAWVAEQDRIDTLDGENRRAARAACGVFWGTYLTVEQSMGKARSGAPPVFRRFTGDGKIAVQVQGGMTVEEATAGDTRLRIEVDAEHSTPRRIRVNVHLRIGSNGRAPVWATVRATLHRPLPDGCLIKWVYLVRRKVACNYKWSVQFVVSNPDGFEKPDRATGGEVGIDLGWRLVDDGLRVAYWAGDDGDSGQLILPSSELGRWPRVETLQSTRDLNFDAARDGLASWLLSHETIPDWLAERTKTLWQWKSQARLAGLVIHWRDNRFNGDALQFDSLEAWRKQDRHLYEWQANQARKSAKWRQDLYRNFAATIRRRYATVHLENINWRELQERASPETNETQAGAREYMRIAAVGSLAEMLRQQCCATVKVDPAFTTKRCHKCGVIDDWDAAATISHDCSGCGVRWDQDYNAAMNLLASSEVAAT